MDKNDTDNLNISAFCRNDNLSTTCLLKKIANEKISTSTSHRQIIYQYHTFNELDDIFHVKYVLLNKIMVYYV